MATTSSVATSRGPRLAAIVAVGLVAAGLVAVALLRRPEPAGPGGTGFVPTPGTPRAPGRPEASVDVSQITVMYGQRTDRPGTDRTKAEALEVAKQALKRIAGGVPFERVLEETTDDRDEVGKPFNRGSYTIAESSRAMVAVKQVAYSTPVGLIHPHPIDTGVAWLILRRDR